MSCTIEDLNKLLTTATAAGLLDDLQSFCKSPDSINDVCDAVDQMRIAREASAMPKDLHEFYYLDLSNFTVYKVRVIPQIETPMMKVYDVGRSPSSYYLVDPKRLGRTQREAIRTAMEELKEALNEVMREAEQVEYKRIRIVKLLELGEQR
jgi:hypothetical protein